MHDLPRFGLLERAEHDEDDLAVLLSSNCPRHIRATVANAVDRVKNWCGSGTQEEVTLQT